MPRKPVPAFHEYDQKSGWRQGCRPLDRTSLTTMSHYWIPEIAKATEILEVYTTRTFAK